MANLVWAADGEWNGAPVKAGDPIPEMPRPARADLYTTGRAVRAANSNEAAAPPVQVDAGDPKPVKDSTKPDGKLHRPDNP